MIKCSIYTAYTLIPRKRLITIKLLNSIGSEIKNLYKKIAELSKPSCNGLSIIKHYIISKLHPTLKSSKSDLTWWLDTLSMEDAECLRNLLHSITEKLKTEKHNYNDIKDFNVHFYEKARNLFGLLKRTIIPTTV